EIDNSNLNGERMSCPVRPRVTYGQSDGIPDGWAYPARAALRTRDRHSGEFALRITPGKSVLLTPTVLPYAAQLKGRAALPPLFFAARVKGSGPKAALAVTLTLAVSETDPKEKKDRPVVVHTVKKSFVVPAQWGRVGFEVPSADIVAALKGRA